MTAVGYKYSCSCSYRSNESNNGKCYVCGYPLTKIRDFKGDKLQLLKDDQQRIKLHKVKDMAEIIYWPSNIPKCPFSSMSPRKWMIERDGNVCLRCGTSDRLTIDHIVPKFRGGHNMWYNLQTLCFSCNGEKGLTVIDYRKPDPINSPCIQHRNFK